MQNPIPTPGSLPRILVVDDDEGIRESMQSLLSQNGMVVETAGSAEEAIRRSEMRGFDLVFLDQRLPGEDGIRKIGALRVGNMPPDVVILTGFGTIADTVDAIKRGASDVIEKPLHPDRIVAITRRLLETRRLRIEVDRLRGRVKELTSTEIVGVSPAIRDVMTRIDQVASAPDTTVLIEGESGSGKELVARCIHERSARRDGPFVAVNCAALTENLLEAELFGYEPGAFTGAAREGKNGLFAAAEGGTILLDEIGEMAWNLQAKLLRVLQEKSYRRVGGLKDRDAHVRILASTNKNLKRAAEDGKFRQDLFYRLNVMAIQVPPLRARPEDVPLLSHYFLDRFCRQMGKALSGFTDEAMEILQEYTWPGNVRELKNAIEHAAIVCPSGTIDEPHLPTFSGGAPDGADRIPNDCIVLRAGDLSLRALEGKLIARVLEETRWNISKSAEILGINRTTLYNKIRVHHLGKGSGRAFEHKPEATATPAAEEPDSAPV